MFNTPTKETILLCNEIGEGLRTTQDNRYWGYLYDRQDMQDQIMDKVYKFFSENIPGYKNYIIPDTEELVVLSDIDIESIITTLHVIKLMYDTYKYPAWIERLEQNLEAAKAARFLNDLYGLNSFENEKGNEDEMKNEFTEIREKIKNSQDLGYEKRKSLLMIRIRLQGKILKKINEEFLEKIEGHNPYTTPEPGALTDLGIAGINSVISLISDIESMYNNMEDVPGFFKELILNLYEAKMFLESVDELYYL